MSKQNPRFLGWEPNVLALGLIGFMSVLVSGFAQPSTTLIESVTPPAIGLGASAGSYSPSVHESINPFSGALTVQVPLSEVKGRGESGATLAVTLQSRWIVQRVSYGTPYETLYDDSIGRQDFTGFGGGYLEIRVEEENDQCNSIYYAIRSRLRLNLRLATGSDIELVDTLNDGLPLNSQTCHSYGLSPSQPPLRNRGRTFRSKTGEGITYVNDSDFSDRDGTYTWLNGVLYFKDGSNWRIDNGRPKILTDRNGNKTLLSNPDVYGRPRKITDSINRETNVEYGTPIGGNPHPNEDHIKYYGQAGQLRTSIIRYAALSQTLYPGQSHKYLWQLFPAAFLPQPNNYRPDPFVIREIELPDGRKYSFLYNSYGEVARMTLPTGGRVEYVWEGKTPDGSGQYNMMIYRRVAKRTEYGRGATTPQAVTEYECPMVAAMVPPFIVTERHKNSTETVTLRQITHQFHGTPLQSASTMPMRQVGWREGRESSTTIVDPSDPSIAQHQAFTWKQRNVSNSWATPADTVEANSPKITETQTTVVSSGVTNASVSKVDYSNDEFDNEVSRCIFNGTTATGSPLECTTRTYKTASDYTAVPVHLRGLVESEEVVRNAIVAAKTTFEYDQYSGDSGPLVDRSPAPTGHNSLWSTAYLKRGNITGIRRQVSAGVESIANQSFDITGNVVAFKGPEVMTLNPETGAPLMLRPITTVEYADSWESGSPLPTQSTFGFPTKITNHLGHETTAKYDYNTGSTRRVRDVNNNEVTLSFDDPLDRFVRMDYPNNLGYIRADYQPSLHRIGWVESLDASREVANWKLFDGFGRVSRVEESGTGGTVVTETEFDELGRAAKVSNPGYGTRGPWTITTFDVLDRPTTILAADSLSVTHFKHEPRSRFIRDPAGVWVRQLFDAAGRMTSVTEDPPVQAIGPPPAPQANPGTRQFTTTYQYNALGQVTRVIQPNRSDRVFTYNQLGLLTSAVQPETGTISWEYDHTGNQTVRTDGYQRTTTSHYDGLSRIVRKTYQHLGGGDVATTPVDYFCYDGIGGGACGDSSGGATTNSVGQLTAIGNAAATVRYLEFDRRGRLSKFEQSITGESSPWTVLYAYNHRSLTTTTLPTQQQVAYTYANSGQVTGIAGYLSGVGYEAFGGLKQMTFGNGVPYVRTYSSGRQQLRSIELGASGGLGKWTFSYCAGQPSTAECGTNNGNVRSQAIFPIAATQSYSYDQLNRLASVSETGAGWSWGRTHDHDPYGNMWVTGNTGLPVDPSTPGSAANYLAANNRLMSPGLAYNAAGDLTAAGGQSYTYYATGKLRSSSVNGLTTEYAYNPAGNRVAKVRSDGTLLRYLHDPSGNLLLESGETNLSPGREYQAVDHLGSVRATTNSVATVVRRMDYLPFGETIRNSASTGRTSGLQYEAIEDLQKQARRFTGKERDAETGLDYFGARYMSAAMGRFTSPDAPFADQHTIDPQSWNLYAYVRNNPLKNTDPNGRTCVSNGSGGFKDVDGPGGTCVDALNGDIAEAKNPSVTVTEQGPPSPQLLSVAQGAQRAGPIVEAAGWGTLGIMGGVGAGAAAVGAPGIVSLGNMTPQAVSAGGAATAYSYQLMKDSYRSLQLVDQALGGVSNAANTVIAGGGNRAIRDVSRLVATYGGKASDWVKVTTPSDFVQRGRSVATKIEVHFYQNVTTGQIVELKTKLGN